MRSKTPRTIRWTDAALSLAVLMGALSLSWAGLKAAPALPAAARYVSSDTGSAIPDEAYAVVIDAGHGGADPGAIGTKTGVLEAELNLEVAKLLADELTCRGIYVIMTRTDENALGSTKRDDMERRRSIMRHESADIVISIHMNKFGDSTVSGPMAFYMKGSSEGRALAESVIARLCESIGRPTRAANPEDLFVLREPIVPSVLVECGFLSNPDDEAKLSQAEYQKKLAKGIADGVCDYFAGKRVGDND